MTESRAPLSPDAFRSRTGVSRETLDRLSVYADLLSRWQRRINLVGKGTVDDLWRRHMLDSAQLLPLIPPDAASLADLGSGGGFPGLVLAIMGARGVHLIESNARKCAFLQEVARATETDVQILNRRIEDCADLVAVDVVTARACASLAELAEFAAPLLSPGGMCLFLKGRNFRQELTACEKEWKMTVTQRESVSDPSGTVLCLGDLTRRHGAS